MGARTAIAIDLGSRRLRALLAERGERRLKVKRVVTAALPAGDAAPHRDDPEAMGRWIGQRLREASFPMGNAVFAMSREQVVLKHVTLPSVVDAELPEMTRLAIQRDLPFPASEAVIDFLPLSREGAGGAGTVVLAVAIRAELVAYVQKLAKAAGLGVERISLRSLGAAALAAGRVRGSSASAPSNGEPATGRLIIDITGEAVEFTVIDRGAIRFSRAAPLADGDVATQAEAVATETRRTWLSYRVAEDSRDVGAAIVLGERAVAERAAKPIGQLLHVPAEVLEDHPLIDQSRASLDGAWSLAGLLLQGPAHRGLTGLGASAPILKSQTIDFARPRRAPDLAARQRQLILAGVGLALVALFGAWTAGRMQWRTLQGRALELSQLVADARPEHDRFLRDQDKQTHLQRWESVRADWLSHLAHLSDSSPPPSELVLDRWIGSMEIDKSGVSWDRRKDAWSAPIEVRITLDGEAKDRSIADAYRDALVRDESYTTNSSGAESLGGRRLPHPFKYILQTSRAAPGGDTASTAPAAHASTAGGREGGS